MLNNIQYLITILKMRMNAVIFNLQKKKKQQRYNTILQIKEFSFPRLLLSTH